MKIKELIENLKTFDQNATVLVSSDEELNTLFERFDVGKYIDYDGEKDIDNNEVVIFGFSGSEKGYQLTN